MNRIPEGWGTVPGVGKCPMCWEDMSAGDRGLLPVLEALSGKSVIFFPGYCKGGLVSGTFLLHTASLLPAVCSCSPVLAAH